MNINKVVIAINVWLFYGTLATSSPSPVEIRAPPAQTCIPKTPPPAGVVCGGHGILHKPARQTIGANSTTLSYPQCKHYCLNRQSHPAKALELFTCQAFAFNPTSNKCVLYATKLDKMEFQKSSSAPFAYYEKECYSCSSTCPQQEGANLVDNGGFELSKSSYGPWLTSSKAAQILATKHGNNYFSCPSPCTLRQYIALCKGEMYHVSLRVKIQKNMSGPGTDMPRLKIEVGDLRYERVITSPSGKWVTYSATFVSVGNVPQLFVILSGTGLKMGVDSVQLNPIAAGPKTSDKNLLINGGFESGRLGAWAYQADPHYNGPGQHMVVQPGLTEGSYKFMFNQHTYAYDEYSYGGFTLVQTVNNLVVGNKYVLSLDFRDYPKLGRYAYAYAAHGPYEISAGSFTWIRELASLSPTNEIKHFSRAFTAEARSLDIRVDFFTEDYYVKSQNTELDNIKLRAVAA